MESLGIVLRPANKCTAALRSEFETLFCSGDFSLAYTKALVGLRQSHVRSVCWRLFLGVLSKDMTAEQWRGAVDKQRAEYHAMREKYLVDPHKHKDLDPNFNNPLSMNADSPWSKFFETAQLEEEIKKDLGRLYAEHEFFTHKEVKERMDRILTLWSTLNPDVSYRQGMHELLAPIILTIDRDKVERGGPGDEHVLCHLMDANFVEHDSYVLFSHLMFKMKDAFTVQKIQKPVPGAPQDPAKLSPVLRMCHRIHNVLLKKKDFELHQHLQRLEIEPQLYALKWVRLLLGREFHLEDVMNLWDAIFSDGPSLSLLEYICVAMIIYIRADLLQKEQTGCLKRLMKYPPVEHVSLFVERALQLRDPTAFQGRDDPLLQRGTQGTVVTAASHLAAKAASGVVSAIKGASWAHQEMDGQRAHPDQSPQYKPAAKPSAKSRGLFDDVDDAPPAVLKSVPVSRGGNHSSVSGLGIRFDSAFLALTVALEDAAVSSPEISAALSQLLDVRQYLDPPPAAPAPVALTSEISDPEEAPSTTEHTPPTEPQPDSVEPTPTDEPAPAPQVFESAPAPAPAPATPAQPKVKSSVSSLLDLDDDFPIKSKAKPIPKSGGLFSDDDDIPVILPDAKPASTTPIPPKPSLPSTPSAAAENSNLAATEGVVDPLGALV